MYPPTDPVRTVGPSQEDTVDYIIWALLVWFSGLVLWNMWEDFSGAEQSIEQMASDVVTSQPDFPAAT